MPRDAVCEAVREPFLQLLEGRRLAIEVSMWQAPTLTVTGQAFLLLVLTDSDVGWAVASLVTAAGVLTSVTVALALAQQRDRERLYSVNIANVAMEAGWPDPRRRALQEGARSKWSPREWKAWTLWAATLLAFVLADIAALICTRV